MGLLSYFYCVELFHKYSFFSLKIYLFLIPILYILYIQNLHYLYIHYWHKQSQVYCGYLTACGKLSCPVLPRVHHPYICIIQYNLDFCSSFFSLLLLCLLICTSIGIFLPFENLLGIKLDSDKQQLRLTC